MAVLITAAMTAVTTAAITVVTTAAMLAGTIITLLSQCAELSTVELWLVFIQLTKGTFGQLFAELSPNLNLDPGPDPDPDQNQNQNWAEVCPIIVVLFVWLVVWSVFWLWIVTLCSDLITAH